MKKLAIALAVVMMLSVMTTGLAVVSSAEETATPTYCPFTLKVTQITDCYWGDDAWNLDAYPELTTLPYPSEATEVDGDEYLWSYGPSIFFACFDEPTAIDEIVLATIRGDDWGTDFEVYAWNATDSAWDTVAIASSDLDATDAATKGWDGTSNGVYDWKDTWGSYRIVFEESVTSDAFMIGFVDFTNIAGWAESIWNDPNMTYALSHAATTETNAPETNAPETNAPETNAPETNAPETNAPVTEETEETAETNAPETNAPETNAPETNAPETNAPETNAPETEDGAPDTGDFTIASIAIVATAAAGAVLCIKKHKEN